MFNIGPVARLRPLKRRATQTRGKAAKTRIVVSYNILPALQYARSLSGGCSPSFSSSGSFPFLVWSLGGLFSSSLGGA